MRQFKILILLILCTLPLLWVSAQEMTPEPEPIVIPDTSSEIAQPTPAPAPIQSEITLLLAARSDLETLVNQTRAGVRPEGWTGAIDINNPDLALFIRLDLELLAGTLLGANFRPIGWFGVVPSTSYAIARDIRHDLELLANEAFGTIRPPEWIGSEPLLRCDRATQALVRLLELNGVFTLQADRTAPDFCARAAQEASLFVEINYLATNTAVGERLSPLGTSAFAGEENINSNFAVGFLDRSAIRRAGVIPNGTPFRALGRSYAQFSNMMLIEGDGFLLFIDYQFTTVTTDVFRTLADVDGLEYTTTCATDWCN